MTGWDLGEEKHHSRIVAPFAGLGRLLGVAGKLVVPVQTRGLVQVTMPVVFIENDLLIGATRMRVPGARGRRARARARARTRLDDGGLGGGGGGGRNRWLGGRLGRQGGRGGRSELGSEGLDDGHTMNAATVVTLAGMIAGPDMAMVVVAIVVVRLDGGSGRGRGIDRQDLGGGEVVRDPDDGVITLVGGCGGGQGGHDGRQENGGAHRDGWIILSIRTTT